METAADTLADSATGEAAVESGTGFEELREAALEVIGRKASAWTDHNFHDPGVTMMEAGLWALADAFFRCETRPFRGWPAEVARAAWRGPAALPEQAPGTVLESKAADLRDALASVGSRRAAIEAVVTKIGDGSLHRTNAELLVRLLREPLLRRAVLDRADTINKACDDALPGSAEDDTAARGTLAQVLPGLGLWSDEIAMAVLHERRRRLSDLMNRRAVAVVAAVEEATDWGSAQQSVKERFELTDQDAFVAASLTPVPRAMPEDFEETDGKSRIFPPHPLQALTVEPVLDADYRRLLAGVDGVKRGWVIKGVAPGIAWNSTPQDKAVPERPGAFTLLIERDPEAPAPRDEDDVGFLKRCLDGCLSGALGDHKVSEKPYRHYFEDLDDIAPRRLLCDEIGAALLCLTEVVVRARLVVEVDANAEYIRGSVRRLLKGFLSSDRVAPFEPERKPPERPTRAGQIDGPWNWEPELPPGWQPGQPVRVNEVVQLLSGVPGVLGVDGMALKRADKFKDAGSPWQTEHLPLDPHCVPTLADKPDCISVTTESGGECGG